MAMNKKLAKMRKAGRTDLAEAYEKCHTQQEKRVFFIPVPARPRGGQKKSQQD